MRAIDTLLKNKVSFLADSDAAEDVAISSRVRLARNLAGTPFPSAADSARLDEIRKEIVSCAEDSGCFGRPVLKFMIPELAEVDRMILCERRLISRELMNRPEGTALLCNKAEDIALMVNEEDHLRMQAITPGFHLEDAYRAIDRLDSCLGSVLNFSFDKELGYLCCCPTNVGTGMRASVMLHLPALVLSGEIHGAIRGIGKLNLAVRGIFGEGTDNRGNLFQVSNQSTLGESELQIIQGLHSVIRQLIAYEKNARAALLEQDQNTLMDHVGRAYGTLRHAYKLGQEEALNALSFLRLGVDLGMFSHVDIATVNEIFLCIGDAYLQKLAHTEAADAAALDVMRASEVRSRLKNAGF